MRCEPKQEVGNVERLLFHTGYDTWASALELPVSSAGPLVEFVDNGDYLVDIDSSEFLQTFTDLFYRTSYFAKADTKHYGTGTRNHNCSRVPIGISEFDLDDYVRFHKVNLRDLDEHQFLYTRYDA